MKLRNTTTLILGFIFTTLTQAGGSLDLSLSNDAARLGYDAALVSSEAHVSVSALHHVEDGDALTLGFNVVGQRDASSPLYVGVGGQIMGSHYKSDKPDDKRYAALGLGVGGFLRYSFPFHRPLGIDTHAYYAPKVITFADAKAIIDASIKLRYSVIPSAHVYIGYRYNGFEVKDLKKWGVVDKGLNVGFRLNF